MEPHNHRSKPSKDRKSIAKAAHAASSESSGSGDLDSTSSDASFELQPNDPTKKRVRWLRKVARKACVGLPPTPPYTARNSAVSAGEAACEGLSDGRSIERTERDGRHRPNGDDELESKRGQSQSEKNERERPTSSTVNLLSDAESDVQIIEGENSSDAPVFAKTDATVAPTTSDQRVTDPSALKSFDEGTHPGDGLARSDDGQEQGESSSRESSHDQPRSFEDLYKSATNVFKKFHENFKATVKNHALAAPVPTKPHSSQRSQAFAPRRSDRADGRGFDSGDLAHEPEPEPGNLNPEKAANPEKVVITGNVGMNQHSANRRSPLEGEPAPKRPPRALDSTIFDRSSIGDRPSRDGISPIDPPASATVPRNATQEYPSWSDFNGSNSPGFDAPPVLHPFGWLPPPPFWLASQEGQQQYHAPVPFSAATTQGVAKPNASSVQSVPLPHAMLGMQGAGASNATCGMQGAPALGMQGAQLQSPCRSTVGRKGTMLEALRLDPTIDCYARSVKYDGIPMLDYKRLTLAKLHTANDWAFWAVTQSYTSHELRWGVSARNLRVPCEQKFDDILNDGLSLGLDNIGTELGSRRLLGRLRAEIHRRKQWMRALLKQIAEEKEFPIDNSRGGQLIDNRAGQVIDNRGGQGQVTDNRAGQVIDNRGGKLIDNPVGQLIDNRGGQVIDNRAGQLIDNRAGQLIDNRAGQLIDNPAGQLIDNHGGQLIDNRAGAGQGGNGELGHGREGGSMGFDRPLDQDGGQGSSVPNRPFEPPSLWNGFSQNLMKRKRTEKWLNEMFQMYGF